MDEPRSLEFGAFTGGQVHWESRAGLIPLTLAFTGCVTFPSLLATNPCADTQLSFSIVNISLIGNV